MKRAFIPAMSLWQDTRFSLRSLRRQPGFTLISLAILTLGIGANTAIFTAVKTILLDPLPYKNPSQLVSLHERGVINDSINPVSPPVFYEWQQEAKSFQSMAAFRGTGGTLFTRDSRLPEIVHGLQCTWNLFETLGANPALGRSFVSSDDTPQAARTVVLSDGLCKRRFHADPQIVGKTLRLDSDLYTVIGVMPAQFRFWSRNAQYWVPLQRTMSKGELTSLGDHTLRVVARLRSGVTMRYANTELSDIQARYKRQNPGSFIGRQTQSYTLWSEIVDRSVEKSLYILWAAVGFVLLIACVNVANLLLTRSTGRRHEMAIRTAVGATRRKLIRLFLIESLLLSCAGGGAGILLASWLTGLLVEAGHVLPRASEIHMDWTAIGFAAGIAVLAGLIAGLLPAWTSSRVDLNTALHEAGRSHTGSVRRQRYRNILVVAEIALSFVLLAGAGLLLKSFVLLRTADLGFNPNNVLTIGIPLSSGPTPSATTKTVQFYQELLQRVRSLSGVRSAGLVSTLPLDGHVMDTGFTIAGQPPLPRGKFQNALVRTAGPQYFHTLGVPLVRGRFFLPSERLDHADKAIISESFARAYFPKQDPIGQHMRFFGDKPREVVGVVGDVRINIADNPEPMMYAPAFGGILSSLSLVVRTEGDPLTAALPIQKQIAKLNPDLAVTDVLTMDQIISEHTGSQKLNLLLLSSFAGLALLLAAVGLYGVLSYATAQRTSEFGIRLALGATPGDLVRSVLQQGLAPACTGLALGFAGATFLTALMQSLLFHVKHFDPAVVAAVAILLLAVSAGACLLPAWRSTKVDPAQALRME